MNFDVESIPPSHTYKLLVGLVAPRPIALITSMNEEGHLNAAPFSAYNYLSTDPPIVGIGVTNRPDQRYIPKDTARNIRRTGEFVVNVVTEDIAQQMNICATDFPADLNEVEMAGFTTTPSSKIKCRASRRPMRHSSAASSPPWKSAARASSSAAWSPCISRTSSSILPDPT